MSQPLTFQQVILKLHEFWAEQGCVIWEPYNVQVGAGTGNPATFLRVLGPEPWRVAYVEPSVRPDDGRFGENPNRMQKYYQYQVILKPDPGDPQELYLRSLEALGINRREHDIRFVEDNWESPALGAWGLGWEVWLDGQEITQFTYFQQAGGIELEPVSVEITYGIERIVLALQGKDSAWDIDWLQGGLTYAEMMLQDEIDHCNYYFNIADIEGLNTVYQIYEQEHRRALEAGAIMPAYDYVLKLSHLFNVLDTRGAIGVTERAAFFRRMRDMSRNVAHAYVERRESLGYPLLNMKTQWGAPAIQEPPTSPDNPPTEAADALLEIGVEELPAADVDIAAEQLNSLASELFAEADLPYKSLQVMATPRRLVLAIKGVAPQQPDKEELVKGPPANRAFDADGKPTKAAEGFARSKGLSVDDLQVQEIGGGEYVTAKVHTTGRPSIEVLAEVLPQLIASIKFGKSMRWNESGIAFSRPIRWVIALLGDVVIPFSYAGIASGNITRGLRPYGSPEITIQNSDTYFSAMAEQGIYLSRKDRRDLILDQVEGLAEEVGGSVLHDEDLLAEVTNLVEAPTALRGRFDERFLSLPREVLITVMRKHQRYFAVQDNAGNLMPYFITVRNGDSQHLDKVIKGNEHVLTARFSDADFFYKEDIKKPLKEYLPRLATLTFQEKLGSMLDKNNRVAGAVAQLGELLGINAEQIEIAKEAAQIAKADLATQMVVEFTSLQGIMGRHYALKEGYTQAVADAIFEHWLPRGAGDILPTSDAGALLGLTDKLDSLVGLIAAGLLPKSTADPYGLRRAALGIIQVLIDRQMDVNLAEAVDKLAAVQPIEVTTEAREQVLTFISGRLEAWFTENSDYPRDVINAVLAEQATNPYRAYTGIQELSQWVQREDWEAILDGFARCVRITRGEQERYSVDPSLFEHDEERRLYEAYQEACSKLDGGNVDAFLSAFEPMLPAVTAYFDTVLVNAKDEKLRRNRLGLLQAIGAMQEGRADMSLLVGF